MTAYLLLILCLNIDALSFGVAYALKKKRFKFFFTLKISLLSSLFFAIPLFLSKFVFEYLNKSVCNIINGIILIILALSYFVKKSEKNIGENENFSQKRFLGECFAFSVDAIFTAFLAGFPMKFYIIFLFFYFFSNFLAIYFGNFFVFKFNKKIKFRLDFLGGIIFLILGILKIVGI